jgi:hypothetical protein
MPENAPALIAGLLAALITAVAGLLGVRRQMQARERRVAEARAQDAARLLRKYRDPLVRAAFDLQSRLYNIATHDFLGKYYVRGTEAEREYAHESTLFVVGEYLGWVEVMRREIQFLDLRDVGKNRELAGRLDGIAGEFLGERADTTFRVFRAEQRAIGEVMMTAQAPGSRECLGFAAFVSRREDDPSFARWFAKLSGDVKVLAEEPGQHLERIVAIQHELMDLIDFLDPDRQYFPESTRHKAAQPPDKATAGPAMASEGAAAPSAPPNVQTTS